MLVGIFRSRSPTCPEIRHSTVSYFLCVVGVFLGMAKVRGRNTIFKQEKAVSFYFNFPPCEIYD